MEKVTPAFRCTCLGCITTGSSGVPASSPHIPYAILSEMMDEWAAQRGQKMAVEITNGAEKGAQIELAEISGVPVRRIFPIRRGWDKDARSGSVSKVATFALADKLVTAMNMQDEWVWGRLRPFYGPIPIGNFEKNFELPDPNYEYEDVA